MHNISDTSIVHHTFQLERTYEATPARVFEAFADPALKRSWFVEGENHEVEQHQMDFRTGGRESARSRFKQGSPLSGLVCSNETVYLDLVPQKRVVFASSMALEGRPISASLVTVEFAAANGGTTVTLTHQAAFFEGSDGPEMREGGWRKLMEKLDQKIAA